MNRYKYNGRTYSDNGYNDLTDLLHDLLSDGKIVAYARYEGGYPVTKFYVNREYVSDSNVPVNQLVDRLIKSGVDIEEY